jgi:hypothetical protein
MLVMLYVRHVVVCAMSCVSWRMLEAARYISRQTTYKRSISVILGKSLSWHGIIYVQMSNIIFVVMYKMKSVRDADF